MAISTSTVSLAQEKVETEKVKAGHRTVHAEIIIDATPQQVWSVLTDTKSYGSWAKFMTKIDGEIKDQGNITVDFTVDEEKQKINQVKHVISATEGKEFAWSEKFMMGMIDNHRFIVEATADGKTRFIQSDEVKGGMAWLFGKSLMKFEMKNYPVFNRSLKAEAEKRFSRS